MLYNNLSKEDVLEIYNFVMRSRRELSLGQRRLRNLVRDKFDADFNEGTISGWIFRGNIPFANEKTQFKPKPRPKREELYELYVKKSKSAEKLGRKYGVSAIIVIHWLKSYGIRTRTHIESMNTSIIKNELRELRLKKPTREYFALSSEKAYILGVLCGDGCLTEKMIRLEIRRDEEFIKTFVDCFEKVYGLKYNYSYYKPRDTLITQINSIIIAQDLARYSEFRTRSWSVPKEIMESNDKSIIGAFTRGFYDSEGSVSRSSITSSSVNGEGLKQIAFLLKKLGIETTLRRQANGKYYVLYIFRKGRFKIFREKVGFSIKRKRENLDETLNTGYFTKKSLAI